MKLIHRYLRDSIVNRRMMCVSQTILLLTGMTLFSTTQAATQHIVESGETISMIALHYDITQTALIDANGLQSTDIEIGQLLNVPDKNERHNLYRVELGDSLSSLAAKYKVDASELARINKLIPESGLLIGSILIIPSNSERALPKAPTNNNNITSDNRQNITVTSKAGSAANTKSSTVTDKEGARYRVKYGDSLSKVADLHNVNVNTLAQANDMSIKDPLYFGRYITIPTAGTVTRPTAVSTHNTVAVTPVTPVNMQYAVQSGDTLMGIANKFKSDFREVARLSGIDYNDSLVVGQILTIPSKIKSK